MAPSMANYPDLFNKRGDSYHRAMRDQPKARSSEFQLAVDKARVSRDQIVCDVPSGGGYLVPHLDTNTRVICVEYSRQIVSSAASGNTDPIVLAPVATIPLRDACCDRVISIAGLHHFDTGEKNGFFSEAFRVLGESGLLLLADVARQSRTAGFLDEFVGKHNTTGHQGQYFDDETPQLLAHCGFDVYEDDSESYAWVFANEERMIDYCRLLFGLDDVSSGCIKAGIEEYLGYRELNGSCLMNWQLRFILAGKPR